MKLSETGSVHVMFQKLNVLDRLSERFMPESTNSLLYCALANRLMLDSNENAAGSTTMFPTTS